MPVIDVHAHHLPVSLGERFTALSGAPHPLRHPEDQSRRIADLDDAGVAAQVIGLGAVQPYWDDRSASVDGARYANDLYAGVTASSGGRLRALGAVPLPHVEDAAAEAVRCLDDLGFDGIGVGCSARGLPLDHPRFDEFWAELDRRGAVVHLHPGVSNDGLVGISEHPMLLGPVFGSPAEEAVAVARLLLTGTTTRYPRIRFVVASMGGTLLVALSKFSDSLDRGQLHGIDHDSGQMRAELRRLWFDTSSIDPVLTLAARRAGVVDRLVLGSDAPWGSAAKAVAALRENLAEEEVGAVLAGVETMLADQGAVH